MDSNNADVTAKRKALFAQGAQGAFWKELKEFIHKQGNPELFLAIENEMGMKGFWYMKGAVTACSAILRAVESAGATAEKKKQLSNPS